MIGQAHELGIRVIPWAVDDIPTMNYLFDISVDGIITNYPGTLRCILIQRGIALPRAYPALWQANALQGALQSVRVNTTEIPRSKGLESGTLGLVDSLVIGVASTGPAYSIAATLGIVVAAVGFQAPAVILLAFIPIFCAALGYKALNSAEPDCGTSFIWAARAFGPNWGWMAGWAIVVADVLVMASLAQVAAQYSYLLVGAKSIAADPTHPAVFAVGVGFIFVLTAICVRGIGISAKLQFVLVVAETVMLVAFAVTALVRVYFVNPTSLPGAQLPQWSWFNPFEIDSFSVLVSATLLMVFIYWGWDSVLSVNEETRNSAITPGVAAVWSTIVLVAIYVLTAVAALAVAGPGDTGVGLANPENFDDVVGTLGAVVFGDGTIGRVMLSLLILMVLTSAAASTQTTLLPTARTTFSMAFHGALPKSFGRIHPTWSTPTTATWAMGAISIAIYSATNFVGDGGLVFDAVEACGIAIGFFYGLTALSSTKLFFANPGPGVNAALSRVWLPALGGTILLAAALWSAIASWAPEASSVSVPIPWSPNDSVGAIFVFGVGGMAAGLPLLWLARRNNPAFFTTRAPHRSLPLSPDAVAPDLRE